MQTSEGLVSFSVPLRDNLRVVLEPTDQFSSEFLLFEQNASWLLFFAERSSAFEDEENCYQVAPWVLRETGCKTPVELSQTLKTMSPGWSKRMRKSMTDRIIEYASWKGSSVNREYMADWTTDIPLDRYTAYVVHDGIEGSPPIMMMQVCRIISDYRPSGYAVEKLVHSSGDNGPIQKSFPNGSVVSHWAITKLPSWLIVSQFRDMPETSNIAIDFHLAVGKLAQQYFEQETQKIERIWIDHPLETMAKALIKAGKDKKIVLEEAEHNGFYIVLPNDKENRP